MEPSEPESEAAPEAAPEPEPEPEAASGPKGSGWRRAAWPLGIYLLCALVYSLTLGDRALRPSPDNHYVHLAQSWLEGQLHQVGAPPGTNDWACFDTETRSPCPNNRWRFPGEEDRYRFYVSFPPLPAAVILPAVAIFGTDLPDRLFWALLAGFAPMFLFLLLRRLREAGRSLRTRREDLLLTILFAFGTVYYFVSVQGTVWFSAHVLASSLLFLYLLFGLDARRPLLAGLMLGLAFWTRPTTALLCVFFAIEALAASRAPDRPAPAPDATSWDRLREFLAAVRWRPALRSGLLFAAPILVIGALAMWMNHARFGDPMEFGHTYLQVRWRPRIERWGLFNYHYFAKNLAIFTAGLPWLSQLPPFLKISRHGLALWFTTPNLLLALWPRRSSTTQVALWVAILPVALINLAYQNSGWVQFGYRFALDYMPLLMLLLALGGRRFRSGFVALALFAIVVNTFGAITFDRLWQFYDGDLSQAVIFQPD